MKIKNIHSMTLILFFNLLFFTWNCQTKAQTEWLDFTNTDEVYDVTFQENYIWIATSGGLIKQNQITGEQNLYTKANSNLPSNDISALCVDKYGILWIGTWNDGLAKFDGRKWEIFNNENSELIYNRILTIVCDEDGVIWVGTEMGVNRFVNGKLVKDLDIQGIIRFISVTDSGMVFISASNGIHKFINNYQKWANSYCPPNNDIGKLCEAQAFLMKNQNEFWVGNERGLFKYQNEKWQKISDSLLVSENRSIITALCFDKENNLWVGDSRGSIFKLNEFNAKKFNNLINGVYKISINKMRTDQLGNIWICTSSGLYKYSGNFEKKIIKQSIIASGQNLEVFSGSENAVWLKNSRDLYCFKQNEIKQVENSDTLFAGIFSINHNGDKNIWIGDGKGLLFSDGLNWKRFNEFDEIIKRRDKEIFENYKDMEWLKNNYKEYLLHEDEEDYWRPDNDVNNLLIDSRNTLWFSTDKTLVNFYNNNWKLYDKFNFNIPPYTISGIAEDNFNNIWLSTWGGGLVKLSGNEVSIFTTSNSPILDNKVNSVYYFDDKLYIGTLVGLITYDGNVWKEIKAGDLPLPFTNHIVKAHDNKYYFATSNGIFIYDKTTWKHFNTANSGIPNNYISSIALDYANNLWIISQNRCLSIFNEKGIQDEERIKSFFMK